MDVLLRILLLIVTGATGYFFFREQWASPLLGLFGILVGIGLSYPIMRLEGRLREVPLRQTLGGLIGVIVGLMAASLVIGRLPLAVPRHLHIFFCSVAGYLGLSIGLKKGMNLELSRVSLFEGSSDRNLKILDTSAIIDGRIADICETGFLEGVLVIPEFVLYEIQHIADHPDPVKRARGRRGLDILHRLQKQNFVRVKIVDHDFPRLRDVDSKLVTLARRLDGKLITNDYNLNKVAELQGVEVLNVNQLATALRPSVLPGEQMNVRILKEGKEHRQGIGYLDDGTMVVVDDARKMLGKEVSVIVTSLLQTTSGRMIFAKLKEDAEREFYFPGEVKFGEQGER
jgi:uncharacterized protein YacL